MYKSLVEKKTIFMSISGDLRFLAFCSQTVVCGFLPVAGNKPCSSSILCGFNMIFQGPESQNLPSGINSNVPNSVQDPRLHGNNPDPGHSPHPQHHASTRPLFYLHAPPPLPFFQYQWPMPFSYNPFAGFPGMGECCKTFR